MTLIDVCKFCTFELDQKLILCIQDKRSLYFIELIKLQKPHKSLTLCLEQKHSSVL